MLNLLKISENFVKLIILKISMFLGNISKNLENNMMIKIIKKQKTCSKKKC